MNRGTPAEITPRVCSRVCRGGAMGAVLWLVWVLCAVCCSSINPLVI